MEFKVFKQKVKEFRIMVNGIFVDESFDDLDSAISRAIDLRDDFHITQVFGILDDFYILICSYKTSF